MGHRSFAGRKVRLVVLALLVVSSTATAQRKKQLRDEDLPYPPQLPDGRAVVTDESEEFLRGPAKLRDGVTVAEQPPVIDFLFYPGQDYPGKPWSNWGDGCVVDGKFYSAIGDHYAIGRGESKHGSGTAFVCEYDAGSKTMRKLIDVATFLHLPQGHYTPGKIHSRIDRGRDGWLYYATHRGSPAAANDANQYQGDWILRTNPQSGKSEVVVQGPVSKHSIPNSVLDPDRLIFYGGTAAGPDASQQGIQFFAYDVLNRRLLFAGSDGPARCMILAKSTGRLYYVPGNSDGELRRFDPALPTAPVPIGQTIGVRAATEETQEGFVYTVSSGQRQSDAAIWQFNTRTERAKQLGTAAVGEASYIASLDVDPTGRFLYYVPGAHGDSDRDGSPVVQFDIQSGQKKVIAFLHPYYHDHYGFTLKGTYCTAVSPEGDKLYVTWNISRGTRAWDCCGLTVIHIPASER